MITKKSYLDCAQKIKVRKEIFSHKPTNINTLVGLAGPDINAYLEYAKLNQFKEFVLYENDPVVMINQLATLKYGCNYNFGNINSLKIPENTDSILYDLDYCCSIMSVERDLPKFKNTNYIITLSIRPLKLQILLIK